METHLPPLRPSCDGMVRREFLRVGWLTAFGLTAADLLRAHSQASNLSVRRAARAQSCILVWLDGGPSHVDTFDPKPEAPAGVRTVFGTVPTEVPGVRLCEHLPHIARSLRELTLIRSLTHELGNHDTGSRYLLTGRRPTPALEYPSLGSWVAHERGFGAALPPYVAIPHDGVGGASGAARAGYLPGAFSAFNVGLDAGGVRDLEPPPGIALERTLHRRELLRQLDAFSRAVEEGPATRDREPFYEQAYRLMASDNARAALDLSRESTAMREQYGRSRIGSGCLLARRLVEAGTRFVTVIDTGWDTHQQIFRELPDSRFPGSGKLPALDRAFSTLLGDLSQRGLLESTLVVLMGEFGRTPKLNAQGGRDHWPRAGFVCLAGGGVPGGKVIGATDTFGEAPIERPVSPADLAWTLLTLLGIDPTQELRTLSGRPMRILADGSFIRELA